MALANRVNEATRSTCNYLPAPCFRDAIARFQLSLDLMKVYLVGCSIRKHYGELMLLGIEYIHFKGFYHRNLTAETPVRQGIYAGAAEPCLFATQYEIEV